MKKPELICEQTDLFPGIIIVDIPLGQFQAESDRLTREGKRIIGLQQKGGVWRCTVATGGLALTQVFEKSHKLP